MTSTLRILEWPDSLSPEVITRFTKQTGALVDILPLDNGASIFEWLAASNPPDVITPSSYTTQELIVQGLLLPLDHSLLPNLVHLEQGAPDRPSHDPNYYYSIPNDWGTNGIIYRDDLITTPMQSWADFWEMARAYPQQTAVLDDQQDVINMALKRCGYSINGTNPVALDAAEAALMELRPYISHFVTDYKYLIANGDVVLALGWNGDAAVLQEMGVPVAYILPEEGSEMWQDELAIPANVGEPALAHWYLNFLLEPQIAVLQALYTLYPTPNITAQSMLPNHMRDNQLLYPPEGKLRRLEVATLLPPETRERRAEIWERFQTGA